MTAEPRCWGGGGVSHPSQLTTGLVIKSVTTSPTLAGERMLFILQVSILSEQIIIQSLLMSNLKTEPKEQSINQSSYGIQQYRKKKKKLCPMTKRMILGKNPEGKIHPGKNTPKINRL